MSKSSDNNHGSTKNSRIIRVRDLPIYYDRKNDDIYRYVPKISDDQPKINNHNNNNNNNWFYPYVSQTRQSLQQIWTDNKALRERITRGLATGVAHTKTTIEYIRDDETFVPKIAVVTVAGLGGLLIGHKGGAVRRTFYSTVAATVALSACYPKQTTKLVDQVYHRIQNGTKTIFDKPAVVESKDRILHTTQRSNESIVPVKGDYGQGVPADQQFYTTRDVTSEKKV